jgi:dolichol-phosphate mannosyltransferase
MNKALVIVPTYNERENLPEVAQRLLKLPISVDLLVVDDNSPDGTGKLAEELSAKHPSIHVLHRQEKNGLGRAYCAGFKWALQRDYEFILEMDCDLSHNPDDVPRLIEAAKNADLALGCRYSGGRISVITGMPFADPTGGFKCFRRRALEALDLEAVHSNGYSFQIEMTHRLWMRGYKIVEVPIVFTERSQGGSKMSRKIVWEALAMVWRLWIQAGFRRSPKTQNT